MSELSELKINIQELYKIKNITDIDKKSIEAISKGIDKLVSNYADIIGEKNDKLVDKIIKLGKLEEYINNLEDPTGNYNNTIYAGIGKIHWTSDNLQLQDLMERLTEALVSTPPNNILP